MAKLLDGSAVRTERDPTRENTGEADAGIHLLQTLPGPFRQAAYHSVRISSIRLSGRKELLVSIEVEQGPMADEALERLETLLLEQVVPHGGMTLEMLDGYFSALAVGPEPVTPGEFLPLVWGEAQAEDPDHAQVRTDLLMQLWNHILWRVGQPPEEDAEEGQGSGVRAELMPLLLMPETEDEEDEEDPLAGIPENFPLGVAWATGFLQGVALRGEAWQAWLANDEDFLDDMSMVLTLSVLDAEHAAQMEMDADQVLVLEERMQLVIELPGMLHDLNLRRLQGREGGQILH
jgi:uncharacterized protein